MRPDDVAGAADDRARRAPLATRQGAQKVEQLAVLPAIAQAACGLRVDQISLNQVAAPDRRQVASGAYSQRERPVEPGVEIDDRRSASGAVQQLDLEDAAPPEAGDELLDRLAQPRHRRER